MTNTGNVTLTDVTVDEGEFSGTGELSEIVCPAASLALAPGQSAVCTATYVLTQADVDAGGVQNVATATGTPPHGEPPVTSPPSEVHVPLPPEPGLGIVKTADTDRAIRVGQVITYSFAVTNTGNVTLTDVQVVEGDFSGAGTLSAITCPAGIAALAPGETVVCTATYTVQAADLTGAALSNVATATGNPPGEEPPVASPPSEAVIDTPTPPAPPLPVTGGEISMGIVLLAIGLLAGGAALRAAGRRRADRH
ncbi:DUF7507 domain-containing protein [Microbacterium resistens]|uniref:DUF7507 domain-containing protein n=1 Tax=Microbacterium resistens TaxID=156977 RepID=UPI003908AF8F